MDTIAKDLYQDDAELKHLEEHFFNKNVEVKDEQCLSIIAELEDAILEASDYTVSINVDRLWNTELLDCIFAFKREVREKLLQNMKKQRAIILMEMALSGQYKYIPELDVSMAVFRLAWDGLVRGMEYFKDEFNRNRNRGEKLGEEMDNIKLYAINEMFEDKCGDKEKLFAVITAMYKMKRNVLYEGYMWLDNNAEEIFCDFEPRLKVLACNGLSNLLDGIDPSMLEECMTNDFWVLGLKGYDAMCGYMIILGMLMTQGGNSPSDVVRLFTSLLPLELREEAKTYFVK